MSHPFRVLHIRASPFVGGPERQILRYASFNFGAGLEQIVGSFLEEREGTAFLKAAESAGLRTVAFCSGSRAALSEIRKFIRSEKIGLICSHGYKADVLGILAGRLEGVPAACFLRGWTAQDWKVRLYERLDRTMLRFAAAVVALSESQVERMGVPGEKSHVVTNVIEAEQITPEAVAAVRSGLRARFHLPNDCRVIVSAGRLSPEKGAAFFIDAAKMIGEDFPGARFLVFGDGPERPRLDSLRQGSENIIIAGHVPEFRALLPGVDLLVNPSLSEEMPNVVLEAMSCGVPVVATSVGGVPEISGPENALALVPRGSSAAIAHAVTSLLRSPADLASLATRARNRVASQYSPQRQCRELAALYKKVVPGLGDLLSGQERGVASELPFITVAMPVRNEQRHIKGVLEMLLAQDYPKDKYEIIVADGESTDRTRDIVDEVARTSPGQIKLLNNPGRLSSAGRNVGIKNGRGEVTAFVDGHCTIESGRWLRNIAEIMRETGAMCLCRPQPLDGPANTEFQEMIATCRGSALGHGLDSSIFDLKNEKFIDPTSSGAIYKNEVFKSVGIYDESFDACEDVELNYRVWKSGLPAYISPRLTIRYAPREDLRGLFKQLSRYGQGRFRFVSKHPSAISIGQLVPPGFVTALALSLLLAPFFQWSACVFLGLVGVYVAAVLLTSAVLASRHGFRYLWNAPAIFATIHFGLGTGFWKALLTKVFR